MVVPMLALAWALGSAPADLEAAMEQLRAAENATNEGEPDGRSRLQAALRKLHDLAPDMASDAEARAARAIAQVSLARSFLMSDDRRRANAAMDEAIRMTRAGKVPYLGPQLGQLETERRQELEAPGRGGISVSCRVPCRVILDEQPAAEHMGDLLLGRYRIWIEASDGSVAPWRTEVAVATPGEVVTLAYPDGEMAVVPADAAPAPAPAMDVRPEVHDENPLPATPRDPHPGRILPRWASVSMALVGAGVAGAGGALLAINGECQGPNKDKNTCERVYDTTSAGIALVAGGAVLAVVGATVLGIDEARRSRRHRVAFVPGGLTIGF